MCVKARGDLFYFFFRSRRGPPRLERGDSVLPGRVWGRGVELEFEGFPSPHNRYYEGLSG